MNIPQKLQLLSAQLYPNGRAFRMPPPIQVGETVVTEDGELDITDEDGLTLVTEDYSVSGGFFYRLHRAINLSFAQFWQDNQATLWSMMPDNPLFSLQDAHDWYRRLGLYDSGTVPFADMKAAINQRLSWPTVPLDKQHYTFIQAQLRAAGFDVYVYENRFPAFGTFHTIMPGAPLAGPYGLAQYGTVQYGDTQYGTGTDAGGVTVIANYLEESADAGIVITNYRSTFFIAGAGFTPATADFATVPASRKIEFRQLLLKLKPIHTVGFLFVEYT